MNIYDAIDTFSHCSLQEKSDFLIRLAHALTILARETYEVGGEGLSQPRRLRLINEIQHRVMGFLVSLREPETRRYPDEVLVRIILEHPEDADLQQQIWKMFNHLISQRAITA
ncbi:MAG: hypothetical protein U1F76_05350 [Candidatus Competibacteraceae bacterium]